MIRWIFDKSLPYLPERFTHHRNEGEQVVRFLFIGGVSFLFNYSVYYLISRILWPAGDRTLENFIAVAITSTLNYLAHRRWTFRSQGRHRSQAIRYVGVALSAIAIQSFLFWVGYHLLHAHDLIVIFVVAVIIPFYTYLTHKFFTFRESHSSSF
ncbi:GtrA family protein [Patescibacteria group bacterium]|nr:GtrA family protein [Patescibacteria group bacterium]MBP9709732.1 GtrA family protein [Patescibacteria group bacterium]